MIEKGRIARALEKSARSGAPRPQPKVTPTGRVSAAFEVSAAKQEPASPQRVRADSAEPDHSVVVLHDKWGEAASQIRAVRDKILVMQKEDPLQVIAVTSGAREEGKTTIAANLAVALSEVGTGRVILVDGDVRGAGVHRILNVDAKKGLYDILHGSMLLNGTIHETAVPKLDIISSGTVAQLDGHQAALTMQCEALLRELRKHYSYVIIDTPPVMVSSEARTFSKYSDGTVVVARVEKTPRDVVKRALEELRGSGATLIGCILTHRKHHVPNFIYALFSHTPGYYYRYYRRK